MKGRTAIILIIMLLLAGVNALHVTKSIAQGAQKQNGVHRKITEYNGPGTCVDCHEEETAQMFGTVHYQWTGPTPNVTNIGGNAGKADVGFNTYCGSVVGSRRIACWTCHVGYGKVPKSAMTGEQLNNIDCLTCHQEKYKRKGAPPYEQITHIGIDGMERTWTLPLEDVDGNFQFMPDSDAMTISILEAARTVHLPTRATCLSCHAYAAGSDCGKRGDLSSENIMPPYWADVHMSLAGESFSCQKCHDEDDHKILGRGLDLRPNDRPGLMTCLTGGCHSTTPHESRRLDNHTGRVACQTCHIPRYAKLHSTEIDRDWTKPWFDEKLYGGQGGFKPEELRESMITPVYHWYNGISEVYALGQQTVLGESGAYEFALPKGWVNTNGAFIYPMKSHHSNSARHVATGQMIPHNASLYFFTGDFEKSVTAGQEYTGLTGDWSLVDIHTFQTINHGVEPKEEALSCGECHSDLSDNNITRMDLQGELGYNIKGDMRTVCTQCHEFEDEDGEEDFIKLHNEHVADEKINCSWCHNFSRPPRMYYDSEGDNGHRHGKDEED
jgi:hypothetical protein